MHKATKKKVMVIVVLLIIFLFIVFLNTPKNCKSDLDCFNRASVNCNKAKATAEKEGSIYNYEIVGSKKDNCLIDVTLLRLSPTHSNQMKEALEGRSMTCSVERAMFESTTFNDIKNLNDFCTGSLKEATLEITIDEMYNLIVKNLGPIASELREINK